jgi:glutamine---fructose-6-phosphate transaminase (isomerizing)
MAARAGGNSVEEAGIGTSDRAEAFLADILAGPRELADVRSVQRRAIRDVPLGALGRPTWRLVGMGSSRFAALDAAARLRATGLDAHAHLASASGLPPGDQDTLLVAISASGRTPEVLAAVEHHIGTSFVLGLTARPDSPLARLSDAVVPLAAERVETAGIACLTYRAAVMALVDLAGAGETEEVLASLADAPRALGELLDGRSAWLERAAGTFDRATGIHVLGDGARMGTLEQAALVLREAPRLPAMPFDTGDWLHAGLYTLLPGDPVLLFCGSRADRATLATIRGRGGRVVAVGPLPEGEEVAVHVPLPEAARTHHLVRPMVESAVPDLIAAELWRRTGAREVEPASVMG